MSDKNSNEKIDSGKLEKSKQAPTVTSLTTSVSAKTHVSGSTARKVKEIEWLMRVVILGIVLSIVLLVVDMYRDNDLHKRITELEREIADYRIESMEKINEQQIQMINLSNKEDLKSIEVGLKSLKNCLKAGGWNICFNQ